MFMLLPESTENVASLYRTMDLSRFCALSHLASTFRTRYTRGMWILFSILLLASPASAQISCWTAGTIVTCDGPGLESTTIAPTSRDGRSGIITTTKPDGSYTLDPYTLTPSYSSQPLPTLDQLPSLSTPPSYRYSDPTPYSDPYMGSGYPSW